MITVQLYSAMHVKERQQKNVRQNVQQLALVDSLLIVMMDNKSSVTHVKEKLHNHVMQNVKPHHQLASVVSR